MNVTLTFWPPSWSITRHIWPLYALCTEYLFFEVTSSIPFIQFFLPVSHFPTKCQFPREVFSSQAITHSIVIYSIWFQSWTLLIFGLNLLVDYWSCSTSVYKNSIRRENIAILCTPILSAYRTILDTKDHVVHNKWRQDRDMIGACGLLSEKNTK